jgi:hypothetical protein
MDITKLILIVVVLLVIFLAARFILKSALKAALILLIFILGFVGYRYYFKDYKNQKFVLIELQDKYCKSADDPKGYCQCIIAPLLDASKSSMDKDQFNQLGNHPLKEVFVVYKAIKVSKPQIKECLRQQGNENAWSEFSKSITSWFRQRLSEFFGIK